jgi:hypothetical protein
MQRQTFNSDHRLLGSIASRFGAILAMTGLLLLSACDGSGDTVTDNNLPEFGKDGVPPVLESVTVQPNGIVEPGDLIKITIVASEALMTPVAYINGVEVEVTGGILNWSVAREITESEPPGNVTFSIVFQDISGDNWKLDFAGVGPAEGDTTWWSIADTGPDGPRACWFDDLYAFGRDGSFANVQGDETWIETWQGAVEDGCDSPVAPHDGSNNAVFEYDEEAGTLKLTGKGAYLGVSKAANGVELIDPADAPGSVTYKVVELVGNSLTVRVDYGGGWWEYRLTRISNLPVVGKWKLSFAGVHDLVEHCRHRS